ncbi:ImmA/IrrE family metallo-endopeptidase [Heyndrickxia sp. FSL W8-0423]|uniref:ImmA/IrrE family metallo-endopeptidase n=1 Tax=Heyndrickxia sp. FSL W8-0423 TaxID=2921601 RepID=UPI0030F5D249
MTYYIKQRVKKLIKKFKTNNPYDLANYLNINLLELNLHKDILGFYKYEKKTKWIVLNSNSNEDEKYFTCCHELGHGVLHARFNTPHLRRDTMFSISKFEREANLFAVELMLPDEIWNEYINHYSCISDLERVTGIPQELLTAKYNYME